MITTTDVWEPWQATDSEPWNVQRVWHLHRRAGWGATWPELQRDLGEGVDASVARFVRGNVRAEGEADPNSFATIAMAIGQAAHSAREITRLKAWWVFRILFSPDPLAERLTLMWHNHFATSYKKVLAVRMMWEQNNRLRAHGRAKFRDLLHAVIKDPAMLVWLDAEANRRTHPNENLARELMELFTLGEGHFSETDVKEVARCLTGLRVQNGEFKFVPLHFDDGEKVVLGTSGPYDCDELLDLLAAQPETAKRIAWRLCDEFFGDQVVADVHLEHLANQLIGNDFHIGQTVETILRSRLFFSKANLRNQVVPPVGFAISTIRCLELTDPPPRTVELAWQMDHMGQHLFEPPNVFGWRGGRAWINTRSLVVRSRFVEAVLSGKLHRSSKGVDVAGLLTRHKIAFSDAGKFFGQLLMGKELKQAVPTEPEQLASWVAEQLMSAEGQLQ